MSFDGMFTHAIVRELQDQFIGGRIHKVQQPYDQEIILSIRSQRKNHKLLLSSNSNFARIQVTEAKYGNPDTPPNFCMFLRKYIEGGFIQDIKQYENDRVVIFSINRTSEIGDSEQLQIVIELMGRHSNIFLLNSENTILDCIKHVPMYQNTFRTILPGAQYKLPPQGGKINPFKVDSAWSLPTADLTAKNLQQHFMGLGRDSANELLNQFDLSPDQTMGEVILKFSQRFDQPVPTLINHDNKTEFTAVPYDSIAGERKQFESLSDLLDNYYAEKAQHDRVRQIGSQLIQIISKELSRNRNKLQNLRDDLAKSNQSDDYRIRGELLTTYLFQVKKGDSSVTLPNFYDNEKPLEIKLNPAKTPSQNMQHYFHQYNKYQTSVKYIHEQMAKAESEVNYLESVESQIELAEPTELDEIRQELIDEGYIKSHKKNRNKRPKAAKPLQFETSSGVPIMVGRNNKQNDELTMRKAKKDHFWFHTKDIPGSHVILMTNTPTDEEIVETAKLAAGHSKYRHSANVPVDYTQVKHVFKPNGSKPGFVNYFEQQTVFVTPE